MKVRLVLISAGVAAQLCLSASTWSAEVAESGRRIDNARVDQTGVTPPAEINDRSYPLPSGVTQVDARAMRAAVQNLPQQDPNAGLLLQEHSTGALFASGKAELTESGRVKLDAFAAQFKDHPEARFEIAGHTDNQRLSPATQAQYRDNQGLSEARALAVAGYLKQLLGLDAAHFAVEGYGEAQPIASNATPEGMAQNRRVEIRAWIGGAAPALSRACEGAVSASTSSEPFRISVDGKPLALNGQTVEADGQRCADVALEKADIQVRYDDLAINPELNVWAYPDGVVRGEAMEFRAWSNYLTWITRAELRIFRHGQLSQETPFAVLPMAWNVPTKWIAPMIEDDKVFYLLRVYDAQGHFDETSLKPLVLLAQRKPPGDIQSEDRERLTGYGENSLNLRNIPVKGGTITVNGDHLRPGQRVETLGLALPVDARGRFAIKQIMPPGPQSVEVKLIEADGSATLFRRNLTVADHDKFYFVVGDLTVGRNNVSGPAALVTGDTQHYDGGTYTDGRGAFYLKDKFQGNWILTAAADTGEQPIASMFSNFSSKDPNYLLRNINQDTYYPVYGDDSTTVDDAPTQGKFYVRLDNGDSRVMWGNFQTAWNGTELLQYSRALYGGDAHYRSEATTAYGEKRTDIDAFAADPGTLDAREEFRGTGGSLYYLQHQDITQGSERIWVEVRDKDSGLVIERRELLAVQDYDIDYLQGRIMLSEPLASSGNGSGLVMTSAINGNPLYLVTTYEYVPGLDAIQDLATGARATQWINDWLQLGLTSYHQGDSGSDQTLRGLDATLRYRPGTYLHVEGAQSEGAGNAPLVSADGGFGFIAQSTGSNDRANAGRIDAAVDLADVTAAAKGKVAAYVQNRGSGFSGPGQIALNGEATRQQGLRATVQVAPQTQLDAKADVSNSDTADTRNVELGVIQQLNPTWKLSGGVRHDQLDNQIANASPTLSQNGGRTDAIAKLDYRPLKDSGIPGDVGNWGAYGFFQDTLEHDGTREANDRAGVGGDWRLNDRVSLLGEVSDGDLGVGGKLGSKYRLSDRSNAYLNYEMETESPLVASSGRQGTWVSGSEMRVSDNMRIFGETRSSSGSGADSLTQAFGLDLAASDRWTYGLKSEYGTVSDPLSGDLDRKALSVSTAYKYLNTKYSGSIEWRDDDGNLVGHRVTWLTRNTFGMQATAAWRLLGKLNYSASTNSQGAFYDGDFHEFVLGGAYRPVDNDRWNTLIKYTDYYNLPSPGQVTADGSNADYAQRSQIVDIDTIYDVRPWFSLGAKYGMRIGEVQYTNGDGDWFSSRADLMVLRADWHWVKEWDALVELRNLRVEAADDSRAGMLLGIYRHLGPGIKAGVGYNFTDYSDDLTDLSYRSRGWFVNLLGTM